LRRSARVTPTPPDPAQRPRDDRPTVIAVGVLAATLSATAHETLGHGLGCLAGGGHVSLLTSIFFRCSAPWPGADFGGPIGNLLAGAAAIALLKSALVRGPVVRLFLLLFGSINLLWLFGQMIADASLAKDDWMFFARALHWPAAWRVVAVATAAVGYLATVALITGELRRPGATGPRPVPIAYVAGMASAAAAGLAWSAAPARSALEGLLTLGVNPLGLLAAAWITRPGAGPPRVHAPVPRAWSWIAAAALAYLAFVLLQGRGLGELAGAGLGR
jgi:hypothetical protein